ncbi:MAG: hypothetical protein ACYDD1_12225 [Caulobacteraceae bacterium]
MSQPVGTNEPAKVIKRRLPKDLMLVAVLIMAMMSLKLIALNKNGPHQWHEAMRFLSIVVGVGLVLVVGFASRTCRGWS